MYVFMQFLYHTIVILYIPHRHVECMNPACLKLGLRMFQIHFWPITKIQVQVQKYAILQKFYLILFYNKLYLFNILYNFFLINRALPSVIEDSSIAIFDEGSE